MSYPLPEEFPEQPAQQGSGYQAPGFRPQQPPYDGTPSPHQYAGPVGHSRPVKPVMPGPVMAVVITGFICAGVLVIGAIFSESGGAFGGILAVIAFAASLALATYPGKESRLAMTILAGLWTLSVIGAVISIPIIIALWVPQVSKDYFAACELRISV